METNSNFYFDSSGDRVTYESNESGIRPVEDKLLLLPDEACSQIRGIIKPETTREQERLAQVRALLVEVGGNCFENWDDPIPEPGQRVMVMKYAGIRDIEGRDGKFYQICTDRDITAILTDEEHLEKLETRIPLGQTDAQTESRIIT